VACVRDQEIEEDGPLMPNVEREKPGNTN